MTQELLHQIVQRVLGPLQWLTEEEERQVMALVNKEIWLRRERESQRKG